MSSPLSSLKKSRKSPLQSFNQVEKKNIPYRYPEYNDDESKLLEEITGGMAAAKLKTRDPITGGVPQGVKMLDPITGGVPQSTVSNATSTAPQAPGDFELMTSMMTRIAKLEQRVQFQAKEIIEKDRKIKVLQEKAQLLNKAKDNTNTVYVKDLENKCFMLQKQVHQMESFLADYGMIWVGEDDELVDDSEVYHSEYDADISTATDTVTEPTNAVWQPGASVLSGGNFKIDYDLVLHNIEELNALAGDGIAKIQHTTDGARLKMPDPVQLTLYENGIVMFSGPFRPFSDPSTQTCMNDIMDGYFPSELQQRFPDGVPFQVTDKRNTYFKDRLDNLAFQGVGQTLGGETMPSRLVPSNLHKYSSNNSNVHREVTSELPGPRLTVDQFLGRLPSNVIRQGQIIDIRNAVGETIQGSSKSSGGITVVETEAVKELKERLEIDENERPASSREITTLRIKSEEGNNTYVLKMKFSDTIDAVRQHLIKERPKNAPAFHIISTFPKKTYSDGRATLKQCGLVPNANLYLKPIL